MDRLEAMSTLLAVIEAGSMSAASRRLGTPLATISRRVSDLENHLGTQLLNRSSRHLTLTEAGRSYLQACRRILGDIEEAERAASGEYHTPKGELTVTASRILGRLHVVPVAAAFLKAYPDVVVRLRLSDRMLNLQEEQVDLAVRIGELADSSIVARRVGAIRRIVCASPDYLELHGRPSRPEDLADHHCVTFTGFTRSESWEFTVDGSPLAFRARSRLLVNAVDAVIEAGLAGIGIVCVFSYHVAAAVREGRLAVLLEEFEPPPLPVSVVFRGGELLPLKVRAFLDFAAPRLKARLLADEVLIPAAAGGDRLLPARGAPPI
jgi:DNA-binding transcriptional LysR family regulator